MKPENRISIDRRIFPKIKIVIENFEIEALIDSGTSHSFVYENICDTNK